MMREVGWIVAGWLVHMDERARIESCRRTDDEDGNGGGGGGWEQRIKDAGQKRMYSSTAVYCGSWIFNYTMPECFVKKG